MLFTFHLLSGSLPSLRGDGKEHETSHFASQGQEDSYLSDCESDSLSFFFLNASLLF